MRPYRSAARAAIFSLSLLLSSTATAAPPSPQVPVATDPAPLPLPPAPGAQNSAGGPPPATPAPSAADPFNPLNSAPKAAAAPAIPPALPGTPNNAPAASFDPFAAPGAAPSGMPPVANNNAPLAIPNTPLAVPPPAVAPNANTLVPLASGGGTPFGNMDPNLPTNQGQGNNAQPVSGTPFGNMDANLPPGPGQEANAADAGAAAPKAKPKAKAKPFKPSLAAGKKSFESGNFDTARRHLLPLARRGNVEAQYLMGVIYSHDKGKLRDFQNAAFWYDKAAEQGNAEAQFNLGFLLYQGAGEAGSSKSIGVDHAQAAKYLTMAANQNLPMAQHLLSLLYLRGSGVNMDLNQAYRLACTSAEGGVDEAMYNCAMMGVRRPGTTMQDYINSYRWFTILAMRGYPGAAENRTLIARYMPANAIQYAESLVAQGQRPAAAPMSPAMHSPTPMPLVPSLQPQPYMPPRSDAQPPSMTPAENPNMLSDSAIRWNLDNNELSVTRGDMFERNRQLALGYPSRHPIEKQAIAQPAPQAIPQPAPYDARALSWYSEPATQTQEPAPQWAAPAQPMAAPAPQWQTPAPTMPLPIQPAPVSQAYQAQPMQPILPAGTSWQSTGWTMGNEKIGAPQTAQPMPNPGAWPWSGSTADQEKKLRQIREREQYMLSN
jgi:TPR repeat protein